MPISSIVLQNLTSQIHFLQALFYSSGEQVDGELLKNVPQVSILKV